MSTLRTRLAIGACGVAVAILSAGPALAGEVTGSGKKENQNQGKSWCSFSGLNDDPTAPLDGSGPNGPGGQSQSFGQENKLGIADPHRGNPGTFCNPTGRRSPRSRTGPSKPQAPPARGSSRAPRRSTSATAPSTSARSPSAPGEHLTSSAAERTAPRRSASASGVEQQLAGGREVAADDDPLRVEQVAQRGHGAADRRAGVADRAPARGVPVERGGDDGAAA